MQRRLFFDSVKSFLRFQDLRAQKLLVECWWNWTQESILATFTPVFFTFTEWVFFWRTNLENGKQHVTKSSHFSARCQFHHVKRTNMSIMLMKLTTGSVKNADEIEWQIFCWMLHASCQRIFTRQSSSVKLTPGIKICVLSQTFV